MKQLSSYMAILKKEKGISAIALIVAILLLGSIGYIVSNLMARSQESIPRSLNTARAFYLAQGGVEYVGKYLNGQADWMNLTSPPTNKSLGTGNFTVSYSPVDGANLDAVITGYSGTAQRRITVRYNRSGFAIRSQGGITMGNNAILDCEPSNPLNTNCTNTNLGTCPCTQQSVSSVTMPAFTVPSPAPSAPPIGCTIYSSGTIAAGNYYCSGGMVVGNGVTITLSGPVTIYTTTFTLNNNVYFNNSGSAANLMVYAGGNVSISNNSSFKGAIYAPGYNISISNNVSFTGFIAGGRPGVLGTVNVNNNANFDVTAGTNTGNSPPGGGSGSAISLNSWQE
jgi:hypothetical protein